MKKSTKIILISVIVILGFGVTAAAISGPGNCIFGNDNHNYMYRYGQGDYGKHMHHKKHMRGGMMGGFATSFLDEKARAELETSLNLTDNQKTAWDKFTATIVQAHSNRRATHDEMAMKLMRGKADQDDRHYMRQTLQENHWKIRKATQNLAQSLNDDQLRKVITTFRTEKLICPWNQR